MYSLALVCVCAFLCFIHPFCCSPRRYLLVLLSASDVFNMEPVSPNKPAPVTTLANHDIELMSWDELRREARKLESDIEAKLTSYSKFGDAYARSSFLKSDQSSAGGSGDDSATINNDQVVSSAMAVEFEQLMTRV
jgi:hypothetical protein